MAPTVQAFDSDERISKAQRCYECGGEYLLIFFELEGRCGKLGNRRYRIRCIGCKLSARVKRAQANRFRQKARSTRTRHAGKYVRDPKLAGHVSSVDEFCAAYDWTIDQMAHDIEHASKNGCPYCWQLFSTMEHGLRDITLDIFDPRLPPYYRTNVRWCCVTCNSEKQRTPPDLWGAKLAMWKLWRENQAKLMTDPGALGFLPFFVDAIPRAS